jgi:uncharacterized protein
LLPLFGPQVQGHIGSLLSLDPAALAQTYRGPILILQGETDLQSSPEDAWSLKAAKPDATLIMLPGLNHVLKAAPIERGANIAAYADPALPLGPGVANAIAEFLKRH